MEEQEIYRPEEDETTLNDSLVWETPIKVSCFFAKNGEEIEVAQMLAEKKSEDMGLPVESFPIPDIELGMYKMYVYLSDVARFYRVEEEKTIVIYWINGDNTLVLFTPELWAILMRGRYIG